MDLVLGKKIRSDTEISTHRVRKSPAIFVAILVDQMDFIFKTQALFLLHPEYNPVDALQPAKRIGTLKAIRQLISSYHLSMIGKDDSVREWLKRVPLDYGYRFPLEFDASFVIVKELPIVIAHPANVVSGMKQSLDLEVI